MKGRPGGGRVAGSTADVIVIGTGFGGAVSACRLASGGMDVLVLERGRWWGPDGDDRDRTPFPRGLPQISAAVRNVQVRRGPWHRNVVRNSAGLYELNLFRHLDTLTASGVGGGSLIYTNMQVQPGPEFFAAFPPELQGSELDADFDAVRAMLQPAPVPRATPKQAAFTGAAGAAGLGAQIVHPDLAVAFGHDPAVPEHVTNAAGVTQRTCTFCGDCVLGCNEGAKTTLDLTYVPAALGSGARLETMCEAVGLARDGDVWQVRYRDHRSGRDRSASARRVVVAAGTLGTLRLLLASRDRWRTLRGVSDRLGKAFSGNADQGTLLLGTSAAWDGDAGPAVTTAVVRTAADGSHRHLVGEASIPIRGLQLGKAVTEQLRHATVLLSMGVATQGATVRLDPHDRDGLDVDQANSMDAETFAGIDADAGALATAAGAGRTLRRVRLSRGPDAQFSVHPLGGCGIGRTRHEGVCDHAGRVFGAPGLYVADAALYPRAVGLPPSMTIAALAERIARLILQE